MKANEEERKAKAEAGRILDLAVAKVGQRMKLLYDITFMVDILMRDVDNALTFTNCEGKMIRLGFNGEKKRHFNDFLASLRRAIGIYETYLHTDLVAAADGDFRREEGFRKDANELIRLVMLYIDRLDRDGAKDLQNRLRSIPNGGIFSEEIINRYNF